MPATSSFTLDASMLQPIVDSIGGSVTALVPIGLGIMAILVGVRMVPRIIHMFM